MDNTELQIWLSNTAHQREVQDLMAAGLNPILSAHGSGAAVPNVMAGDSGSSGSAKGRSGGKSIVDVLDQSLKNSNSALRVANNAVKMTEHYSRINPHVREDSVQPLQSIVAPVTQVPNSGSTANGLNQDWQNLFNYIEYFSPDDINLHSIFEGSRLLRKALTNKNSGHAISDSQWQQLQQAKKAAELKKKPLSKNMLRILNDQASTARALLGR